MSREQTICDNLGLVHTCARRFAGKGIDYDDLYQAGCIGLIKATDGFDPSRGLCFSTYAVPLILGEIRHLFREGGALKVSRSLKSLSRAAGRHRDQWLAQYGREPTVEELAQLLEVEPAVAAQAITAGMAPLSLTRTEDGSADGGEEIDLPTPSPEEQIVNQLAVQQLLEQLEPRDQQLIRLRYLRQKSQQATADQLGMTQVQVSRRERALLHTLRDKLTV